MLYNCIIIDDEESAIFQATETIDQIPELNLLTTFRNVVDAKSWLLQHGPVHLILLDVEMPALDGITGAELLHNHTKRLVFLTAHQQYAFKAFQVHAHDYLQKPLTILRVYEMLDQWLADAAIGHGELLARTHMRFAKDYQGKFSGIQIADIQYIEAMANYVVVHTTDARHTLRLTLKEIYQDLLPLIPIMQTGKSHLVCLEYIDNILGNTLTLRNGKTLQIGHKYLKTLMNEFHWLSYTEKKS